MSPFRNDPFSMVYQAFQNLYPGKECECYFEPDLKADDGDKAYGLTNFCDDGEILIFVDPNVDIENATEIFAHELAHVAVGYDAEHGPEWDAAFDAILNEYNRIGDEMFGNGEGVVQTQRPGDGTSEQEGDEAV